MTTNKKKLLSALLAATMTLSLSVPAMAATATEQAVNGDTTISIFETKTDLTQLSFEVPLYVTMAAVENQTNVVVPSNYGIKNTSGASLTNGIGVTGMTFTRLSGSSFETVTTTPSGATQIQLEIGGVTMPNTPTAGTYAVTLTGSDNTFYDNTGSKYKAINRGATMLVPLVGTVDSVTRTEGSAAAQFRVNFVISALNSAGLPATSANPYAGDDSVSAGLGTWSDSTGTWS